MLENTAQIRARSGPFYENWALRMAMVSKREIDRLQAQRLSTQSE